MLIATIILISLGFAIPRFWIHETPSFLLSKREIPKLYQLIKKINSVEEDSSLMSRIIEAGPEGKTSEKSPKQQFSAMFRKPLKKLTILYLFIWFGAAFPFTGMSSFIPVVLKRAHFGSSNADIYRIMLFQQLVGIPGVFLATKLVKSSLGRKKTIGIALFLGSFLVFGFLLTNFYAVLNI